MVAEQTRQDQLTNDLANASTPGYKPDRTPQRSFGEMLLSNTANGQPIGTIDMGVQLGATVTDMTPAGMHDTGQPLDFGIVGPGFFAVQTPQGVRYTRDGQFSASAPGQLVDQAGNKVLDQQGKPDHRGRRRAGGRLRARRLRSAQRRQAGRKPLLRQRLRQGRRQRAPRGARGIRRGRRQGHGRNDRLHAHLPVRTAGHPGHRPDAAGRLHPGRLAQRPPDRRRDRDARRPLRSRRRHVRPAGAARRHLGATSPTSPPAATSPSASASRTSSTTRSTRPAPPPPSAAVRSPRVIGRDGAQGSMQQTGARSTSPSRAKGTSGQAPLRAVALTRNGALSVNGQGHLMTADGGLLDPPITLPAKGLRR